MASSGIRDRVAIVGMGCTRFGERWDKSVDDLLIDAATEAVGVGRRRRSTTSTPSGSGPWARAVAASPCPGRSRSTTSRSPGWRTSAPPAPRPSATPATRWPRAPTTLAMAIGVEKLKDSGYSGLTGIRPVGDGTNAGSASPAAFSFLAPAYADKYGVDPDEMKEVMTRIAWKNHRNGARQPAGPVPQGGLAWRRSPTSPLVAGQLGVFDCSGVSDGSAAAIVCRAEDAHRYTDNPLYVKALSLRGRPGGRADRPRLRLHHLPRGGALGRGRLRARPASPTRAAELAMAEVHDCFTPTELVLMEDLGFAERGTAWKEVLAGTFDRDGELPVNPDGGLKSFGHPIGASRPAHALRVLAAAPRRGAARAPDRHGRRRAHARPDPQPGRRARRVRELRGHRRAPSRRTG